MAAALFDETVGHAEPQARALAFALGAEERIEGALHDFRAHARAGVRHGQHDVLPGRHIGQR